MAASELIDLEARSALSVRCPAQFERRDPNPIAANGPNVGEFAAAVARATASAVHASRLTSFVPQDVGPKCEQC
jgi:hypothetical protein